MRYFGYGYYFDPTYILILVGMVLSLLASARVKATFSRYASLRCKAGYTGAQTAEKILNQAGIYDVRIEPIHGSLNDHYDPRSKVLRLSDSVFNQTSVAAVSVAAHECGHAIQHNTGYVPLNLRGALVPVANFGAGISWPLILIGLFIGNGSFLIQLGIILFSLSVLFQLVTLPVEFNASGRGLKILEQSGILYPDEMRPAKKVLGAAALTYVAAAAASILQLLRLLILFGGRRSDD